MSSESHGDSSPYLLGSSSGDIRRVLVQPRYSYTRDFLLSLSELDICKKLPAGFDASLLSEFDDASSNSFQQHRNAGGFYSQNSRRNEHGYAQTNRLEGSGNYSRGNQGKWETRSSGSSDWDELQNDQDSFAQDTGKRNLTKARRVWKQTEHDGLLGKPSGYSTQASSQRPRGNGLYTLKKSAEPYQPPRPSKITVHSWREYNDLINDETFGSSECSEDKAEEERKRRASFELMRKEQQKALQDKQKQARDGNQEDLENDPKSSSKNSVDLLASSSKVDDSNIALHSDSSRALLSSSSRPRVPPGFRSTSSMKGELPPAPEMKFALEVEKPGSQITTGDALVETGIQSSSEIGCISNEATQFSDATLPLSDVTQKFQTSPGLLKLPNTPSSQALGSQQAEAIEGHSTSSASILDKLFQSASKQMYGGSSSFAEEAVNVDENAWDSSPVLSSKFSHWFPEERAKPEENNSQDLLSQFFNSEKAISGNSKVSKEKVFDHTIAVSPIITPDEKVSKIVSSNIPLESNGTLQNVDANSETVRILETSYHVKKDTSQSVLTCEHLEQLILAEANAASASKSLPRLDSLDAKSVPPTDVNDFASHHLRSLLHVETSPEVLTSNYPEKSSQIVNTINGLDTVSSVETGIVDTSTGGDSSNDHIVENSPTLECLFGPAFMKELQSTGAPLSAQTGSANVGLIAASVMSSNTHDFFSHPVNFASGLASSDKSFGYGGANEVSGPRIHDPIPHQVTSQEPWTGFQASKVDGFLSTGLLDNNASLREIQLPEDKSLPGAGETPNLRKSDEFFGRSVTSHSGQPIDITRNLVSLGSVFLNERKSPLPGTESSIPMHGSFDLANSDSSHQQLFRRSSSHSFPHQIRQSGPHFQQFDPRDHGNLHTKFVPPDNLVYDTHHQFPPNLVLPRSFHTATPQFDTLQPTMHNVPVHGNASLHEFHGFPRGAMPSHPTNHIPSMLEMNPMHGFPMAHRQPNHGRPGMEMTGMGTGLGHNHPEALERLLQMELRAAKQAHPLASSHPHGSYGPELDMGFRYR